MSGDSRVSIPNSMRRTIQDIKEIAGKHSDEDIYAMLKDCNMDPNETAQKLLYLDTFHEVKRKRDRRKENLKISADFRGPSGNQRQGARGGRGSYYSHNVSYGAGFGRNMVTRKENGVNNSTKAKENVTSQVTKFSTVAASSPTNIQNGSSTLELKLSETANFHRAASAKGEAGTALPQSTGDVKSLPAAKLISIVSPSSNPSFVSGNKDEQGKSASSYSAILTSAIPASVSGVYSSASDPVSLPPLSSQISGAVGTIRCEGGSQQLSAEPSTPLQAEKRFFSNHNSKLSQESLELIDPSNVVLSEVGTITVEASTESPLEEVASKIHTRLVESNSSGVQHVIFPNHLQVPEAFKNGLTFGSLDASVVFGVKSVKSLNGLDSQKSSTALTESFQGSDETAAEPCPSVSSTAQEEEYHEHPQSPSHMSANLLPLESNVSTDTIPKHDQLKQDMLVPPGGPSFPVVQSAPNFPYSFGPPMLRSQRIQVEGPKSQAQDVSHLPNFSSGHSMVSSKSGPTSQSSGVVQSSSIPVSPQPIPVFRQPYPPNFFPYSQYLSPFYVPPTVHQFLGHGGFPQQPSAGNVYLPPPAGAAEVKFPLPQYRPAANTGNQAQIFGSYGSSAVGYNHSLAATSGSSASGEDLATQSRENHTYSTGQQSEGSAVWIPAPGQDVSTLQATSFYNLTPQGQHVAFTPPQAGHGAFAGIYHPAHTMTTPAAIHPFLQQSQSVSGSVEKMGPPSGAYPQQQQQHAQMNWNINY